jgi:transcriptional regulator with XRE-family HTH domain
MHAACKLPYMSTLSDRIIEARLAAGLDPAELARRVGVNAAAAYQWESGATKSLKAETAIAMAEALGVDVVWLVTGRKTKDGGTASHGHSQPVRLNPETVRNVAVALNLRHKSAGGFNLEERPDEFVLAYELWTGMSDAYKAPEVADIGTRRTGISPQGASEHDRGSKAPQTDGATREGARAGRRRKA